MVTLDEYRTLPARERAKVSKADLSVLLNSVVVNVNDTPIDPAEITLQNIWTELQTIKVSMNKIISVEQKVVIQNERIDSLERNVADQRKVIRQQQSSLVMLITAI